MTGRPASHAAVDAPTRSKRAANLLVFALAVVGGLAGVGLLLQQAQAGLLDDVRAYYNAGTRLNEGLPLYPANADPDAADFYRYPPLLAILFRPLAALPFDTAAAIWQAVVIGSLVGTIWWIGPRRRVTWLSVGILGVPIAFSLAVGQAQVPLTLLTALGTPLSIALAANLKLFPGLVALWWVGRREWSRLGAFAAWIAALALFQVVVEPRGSVDFLATLTLEQVGNVRNISPYAVSPVLWAAAVAAGVVVTYRLAPTKWGWPAAVALSILVTPRLLMYMFMTFLAVLRAPRFSTDAVPALSVFDRASVGKE